MEKKISQNNNKETQNSEDKKIQNKDLMISICGFIAFSIQYLFIGVSFSLNCFFIFMTNFLEITAKRWEGNGLDFFIIFLNAMMLKIPNSKRNNHKLFLFVFGLFGLINLLKIYRFKSNLSNNGNNQVNAIVKYNKVFYRAICILLVVFCIFICFFLKGPRGMLHFFSISYIMIFFLYFIMIKRTVVYNIEQLSLLTAFLYVLSVVLFFRFISTVIHI